MSICLCALSCYHDEMNDTAQVLRHFLATLAYRFQKTVKDAPTPFATLDLGNGVREPLALVWHMNGVLGFARNVLATGDKGHNHVPKLSWQAQLDLFHQTLSELDTLLREHSYDPALLERLLQGPLADVMTHIGQLALLRRMAGAPIWGENFFQADIRAGQLDQAQPAPISPDEKQQYP